MEKGHGHLVFFKKNGKMSPEYQLYEGELCIGSNTGNEIRLKNDNPLLLGVHAIVKIGGNGIATIISKSKEAPVTVNDQSVPDKRRLAHSDVFEILGKKFQYFNEHLSKQINELEPNEEIPLQVKQDVSRKSCVPALKMSPNNSPLCLRTKTPAKKTVLRKSRLKNDPEGVQVTITPDKKPCKKGCSNTTSKVIVSKALGSPGNKRKRRLSLNEMRNTSESEKMISSRNVLLSKSTINITISQTHEYSPLKLPPTNTVEKSFDNELKGCRTKSGRTSRKSVKLREIEESPKKSMDLINYNTPVQDTATSSRKSVQKVTSLAQKTPVNKRLQHLKGTNSATKKDTPPPGKGSLIMHRSTKSQTKDTVKRIIKMLSPKGKGNISVTFSPNSLPSSSSKSLNFNTPGKQGSILRKTDTSGAANQSRVSFASDQCTSYFLNDSSLDTDMEHDRSNDEIEEIVTTKRITRNNITQEMEHNYSIPVEVDFGLETSLKGTATRNTSTPLKNFDKKGLSTSIRNATQGKVSKNITGKSLTRSLSANQAIFSENKKEETVNVNKIRSRKSRTSSSTMGFFEEVAKKTSKKGEETPTARKSNRLDDTTLNVHIESLQNAQTSVKKFKEHDLVYYSTSKSPRRSVGRLRKSVENLSRTSPRKSIETVVVDESQSPKKRRPLNKNTDKLKVSPRKSGQSSCGLDESLKYRSDPDSPGNIAGRRSALNQSRKRNSDVSTYEIDFSQEENIDQSKVGSNDDIFSQNRMLDDSSIKILDMDTQEIIKPSPAGRRSRSLSTSKVNNRRSKKFGDSTLNIFSESTQEAPKITPSRSNFSDLVDLQHRKSTSKRSTSVDDTQNQTLRTSSQSSLNLDESLLFELSDSSIHKTSPRRSTQGKLILAQEIKELDYKKRSISSRKSRSLVASNLDTTMNEVVQESNVSKRKNSSPRTIRLERSSKANELDSVTDSESETEMNESGSKLTTFKKSNVSTRKSKSKIKDFVSESETTMNESISKANTLKQGNVSAGESDFDTTRVKSATDSELDTSANKNFKARTSRRGSALPRKSKSMHKTPLKAVDIDSYANKSTNMSRRSNVSSSRKDHYVEESNISKNLSLGKINFFLETPKKSDDFEVLASNRSAESDLSPIKTIPSRRSSARINVLNESSLTSAGEDHSSTSALTISSQSFSSFKRVSTDVSQTEKSNAETPIKERSSRRTKTIKNISSDSVFLDESVKSNRSTRSNNFSDNVSFTSTPFHNKTEIIDVTSTSSSLSNDSLKKEARSEIHTIFSDSAVPDNSLIKETSRRKSRQPLLKRKSVNLEPQTPEINRELEDETPKSHIKPKRLSKSVYNPVTEDITPVTPEKLMVSEEGENVFKTPINTPGLFESIRKSAIRSRKRGRDSQGSALKAKRPRVEFDEEQGSMQQNEKLTGSPLEGKLLTVQPKVQKSPRNRLSNFEGVKRLMKSPQKSPKNDLRYVPDLRPIMSSKSPKNDLTNVPNLKRIMSPRNQNSPLNDLTKPVSLRNLMRTPKNQKEPHNELSDLEGVAGIFNVSNVSGVKSLHEGSDIENYMTEDLFTKVSGKKAPRTYRSLSPKKITDTTDCRKTYGDIPACSPRVEEWVEEQVKITEVPVSSTDDEDTVLIRNMATVRKTSRGRSISPKKSLTEKGTARKPSSGEKLPQFLINKEVETSQDEFKVNKQSLLKGEIDLLKKQGVKTKSSSRREIIKPTKTRKVHKILESIDVDKPEPSKPTGRRKRVLSEDEINTIVPIKQPLKKEKAKRSALIEEDNTAVQAIQAKTRRGKKAVQKADVLDTKEFKKQTSPKNSRRNAKKQEEELSLQKLGNEEVVKTVRGRRGKLLAEEQQDLRSQKPDVAKRSKNLRTRGKDTSNEKEIAGPTMKITRGKNKKQGESGTEVTNTDKETKILITNLVRGGRRDPELESAAKETHAKNNRDMSSDTLEYSKKKRGGRKQDIDTSNNAAPVVESSEKIRETTTQHPEKSEYKNAEVKIQIGDSPKKIGRGRKKQVPEPEAPGGITTEPTKKKCLRAGKQVKNVIEEPEQNVEVQKKKPVRGRKQGVGEKTDEVKSNEQVEVVDKKKPTRGRKQKEISTTENLDFVESCVKKTTRDKREVVTEEIVVKSPAKKPTKERKKTEPRVKKTQVEESATESPIKKATRGRKKLDRQMEEKENSKTAIKPRNKVVVDIKATEIMSPRSPRAKKGQNSKYPAEEFVTPEKKIYKRVHFKEIAEEKTNAIDEGIRRSKRSKK